MLIFDDFFNFSAIENAGSKPGQKFSLVGSRGGLYVEDIRVLDERHEDRIGRIDTSLENNIAVKRVTRDALDKGEDMEQFWNKSLIKLDIIHNLQK